MADKDAPKKAAAGMSRRARRQEAAAYWNKARELDLDVAGCSFPAVKSLVDEALEALKGKKGKPEDVKIDEPAAGVVEPLAPVDLSTFRKDHLLAIVDFLGLKLDGSPRKAEIVKAIEASKKWPAITDEEKKDPKALEKIVVAQRKIADVAVI